MQDLEGLTPAEREVEEAWGRLKPADVSIDRDRLLFRAGQRSVGVSLWMWRGMATVLVAGLGLSLVFQPEAQLVERIVQVPVQRVIQVPVVREERQPRQGPILATGAGVRTEARDLHEYSYIRLRQRLLEEGLDALPMPAWTGATITEPAGFLDDVPGVPLVRLRDADRL